MKIAKYLSIVFMSFLTFPAFGQEVREGYFIRNVGDWTKEAMSRSNLQISSGGANFYRGENKDVIFYLDVNYPLDQNESCNQISDIAVVAEDFCVAFIADYQDLLDRFDSSYEQKFQLTFRDASQDTKSLNGAIVSTAPGKQCQITLKEMDLCKSYFEKNQKLPNLSNK